MSDTMVKAEVDDPTNDYIEEMQERLGKNKQDTVAYILKVSASARLHADSVDAPRDDNNDPILENND